MIIEVLIESKIEDGNSTDSNSNIDGWQLGEHDTWAKMTNFEVALRTPLIIRAPWMKASSGRVTSVLAEAVDFYPTLAALVGLPDPITMGQVSTIVSRCVCVCACVCVKERDRDTQTVSVCVCVCVCVCSFVCAIDICMNVCTFV